jgi:hypothetical protein
MRHVLLFLLLCAGFQAVAADQTGAELRKKPVKAEIVSKEQGGAGNVRVTYADGSADFWTKKGNCHSVHVASDGMVGWVMDENMGVPELPRAYSSTLILCRQGTIIAKISSGFPVIWNWNFMPKSKQVALYAGWYHASPRGAYELYSFGDAPTGKLLQSAPEDAKEFPEWTKILRAGEEQ